MAKCTWCNKEIESLNLFIKGGAKYEFCLDKDGDPQKLMMISYEDDAEEEDFECPECQEVLFHDWDEATDFLKGG